MQNCLITKRGRIIETTPGSDHERTCLRVLNYGVDWFLETGGVRIKAANPDEIVIEYYSKPTLKQQDIIRKILRTDDYYVIILPFKDIRKFRPIRSFNMEQITEPAEPMLK